MKKLTIITILSVFIGAMAFAQDQTSSATASQSATPAKKKKLKKNFESLGGNEDLMQKAKEYDPENRAQIVQHRAVDLDNRFEFGIDGGLMMGGDSYLYSQQYGVHGDFHFNPHWSIGARYYRFSNELTDQGKAALNDAQGAYNQGLVDEKVPAIDYPISNTLAVVDFYPIYGKMNLFDMGVSQFDVYLMAGAGQMQLSSGSSPTYAGGVGIAVWLSQHFTTRLELRYQNYQDHPYTGSRDINSMDATASIGFLL